MLRIVLTIALVLTTVSCANGSVTLFDFERDADLTVWHDEGSTTIGHGKSLERAAPYATSGGFSLRFSTPKWRSGLAEWPAFEAKPTITDWSGYDRLVFDVTNASPVDQKLGLLISDTKLPTRSGIMHEARLPPQCYQQQVVPLAQLAARNVDPKAIRVMHFFTERPPSDMAVYIDRIVLLRPGEPAPVPRASYVRELATLVTGRVASVREARREARMRITRLAEGAPATAAWAGHQMDEGDRKVAAFAAQVARGDPAILESQDAVTRLRDDAPRLESVVRLRARFEGLRTAVQVGHNARGDIVVGFATSMEKVLPRAAVPDLRVTREASVSLAGNEKEAFQVVVVPCERKAGQVSVRVSDLHASGGARLAAAQVQCAPMGYVKTQTVPPYGSSHVGWWPDPILSFLSAVDIDQGDAQSFWVRVRTAKGQPAGTYRGRLEVLVDGKPMFRFGLAVRVYGLSLPNRSPLNLAITFQPGDFPDDVSAEPQKTWRKLPEYPINAWKKHRLEWGDFLADYYITLDNLYSGEGWAPDFEILQRLKERGQLGMFNLGYYAIMGEKPEEQEAWKADVLKRIQPAYEKAKSLGLLDHAYIYGCDENPTELFRGVQRAAEFLRQHFPGTLVMTTTYDHSFGTSSVIQAMDAFCPLTPSFNPELAAKARASGNQVWWYICCVPHHPHGNMFIEYPAIDGRILMGAQTARYRPDGFLYYQISIWNSRKPITSGPFTDWDPRSWTTYHGDGSWTCAGPDGTPLPTIRLENFRDGLEDYAYVLELEKAIQRYEGRRGLSAKERAWLEGAKAAAQVPSAVAASITEFTQDPAAVYAWRNRIGDLIDGLAGVSDVDGAARRSRRRSIYR